MAAGTRPRSRSCSLLSLSTSFAGSWLEQKLNLKDGDSGALWDSSSFLWQHSLCCTGACSGGRSGLDHCRHCAAAAHAGTVNSHAHAHKAPLASLPPCQCSYGAGKDEPSPYTLFPTEALVDLPFTVVHHLPDAGDGYQVRRALAAVAPGPTCPAPHTRLPTRTKAKL